MTAAAIVVVALVGGASALAPSQQWAQLDRGEVERYSRHLILSEVGVEGQEKLKNAKVLCIGAGGLGSPALMYLAAAGVGQLTIVDDDVVDVSNLQRQIVHSSANVGIAKTASAAETLRRVNPLVTVVQVRERFGRENAADLVDTHDVVLDGSDNFETKFLVNDVCLERGKAYVYAAILRFQGQVSVFNHPPGLGATYRDVLEAPPAPGAVPSCAEGGVLGVLCGVLGAIQATECVKLILGLPTLADRLLLYDALQMTFDEIPLTRKRAALGETTEPPPRPRDDDDDDARRFQTIDAAAAAERLAQGWTPFVLDVRLPQEAAIASLPFVDALCPHREVARFAPSLPADADILVHCKSGFRSKLACRTLASLGHDRLFNLDGGILAWADQVDPRMPRY